MSVELAGRDRGVLRHDPGDQPRASRPGPYVGGRAGDLRVPQQRRFDLLELDPTAPQLNLLVDPPAEQQLAGVHHPSQITGPVQAPARLERIGREGRARVGPEVPRRHRRPADVQLSARADRRRLPGPVEHVQPERRHGHPDRDGRPLAQAVQGGAIEARAGAVDRGLRGAVAVDDASRGMHRRQQPFHQLGGQRLPAEVRESKGRQRAAGRQQQPRERRCGVQRVGPVLDGEVEEAVERGAVRRHAQGATRQQRGQQLEDPEVEGRRQVLQHPGVRPEPELPEAPGQHRREVPLGDRHPLGAAGRARGERDVDDPIRVRRQRGHGRGPDGEAVTDGDHGPAVLLGLVSAARRGDDRAYLGVVQHRTLPARGVGFGEGNKRAPSFQDRDQPDQQLGARGGQQADPFPRGEPTRERARAGLELPVGQFPPRPHAGRRRG